MAASNFVREIAALDVDQLTIRINSIGGSVTDGIAIFNALKRHKANVTTIIDGIAASVASLIAMAGDGIEMAENALMMIHAPWGCASGNSVAMREFVDTLDTYADAMASSYAICSGDKSGALALLTDGKDHWYTAEEALAAKFIDVIVAALLVAESAHITTSVQARYASFPQSATPAAAAAPILIITPKESTTMVEPEPVVQAAAADPAAIQAAVSAVTAAALEAEQLRRTTITVALPNSPASRASPQSRLHAWMIRNARSTRLTRKSWRTWVRIRSQLPAPISLPLKTRVINSASVSQRRSWRVPDWRRMIAPITAAATA